MFSVRFAAALFVALSFALSAEAADRYYVVGGSGDGTILYDRPLSVVLARCYGIVDGAVRVALANKSPVPAGLSDTRITLGSDLVEVAKKDRGLDIKIDTFRPADTDDQGIPEDTGAPGTLYSYYDDAETSAERSKTGIDLRPCDGLLADIKAGKNVGAPRERVYQPGGEPLVLALAYCAGRIFTNDWDSGYVDEKELAHDRASMAAALVAAAKRDRGVTMKASDVDNGGMPPAFENAYGMGDDSLSVQAGRPDFQDVADQEFPGVWEDCQDVIKAAQ